MQAKKIPTPDGSSGSNGPAKHEGTRKPTHYINVRLLRSVGSRQVPVPIRHSCSNGRPSTKKACSRGTRAGKKTDQHSRHEGCPWKITARGTQTLVLKGNFATSRRPDTAIQSRVDDALMETGCTVTIRRRSQPWHSDDRSLFALARAQWSTKPLDRSCMANFGSESTQRALFTAGESCTS
jgi:hypothetical protein